MFGLAITNPIMWLGILGLGIPLFIHLLTRRTPVRLLYPTIQFLKSAKASQSRVFRIRHFLLLALRTIVIALVLAAFLKPVYRAKALSSNGDENSTTATVVVLDNSASMGYSGAGVTPFSLAQTAAINIVDNIGASGLINLIVAGAVPTASFDAPMLNRAQFKRDVNAAKVSAERADFDAAIALALRQLEAIKDHQREIHFVSDFQRTNWAAVNFAAIPPEIKVVFVNVGAEKAANVAVTDIRINPLNPARGEVVAVTAKVANYSDKAQSVDLELTFDDAGAGKRKVLLEPFETTSVNFRINADKPGIFEGTLRIPNDALTPDNTRHFTVSVTERIEVSILSDASPDERDSGVRFLQTAVNPFEDETGVYIPNHVRPDELDKFAIANSQAIFIEDVKAFSTETAKQLLQYLDDGGGIVYFIGGAADTHNLELLTTLSEDDLTLPFQLGPQLDAESDPDVEFAVLAQANYNEPLLAKFRETDALASLNFYQFFSTQRQKGEGTVLLQFDNGHIALAQTSFGLGTLLLANFTTSPESSDLVKNPVFLPLVHEVMRAIRPQGNATRSFDVGMPCSTTITLPSPDIPVRFTDPNDNEVNVGYEVSGDLGAVIFGKTDTTGFYRVYNDDKRLGSVAVNIDSRESNLESITLEQIEELSQFARDQFFATNGSDSGDFTRLREGVQIWQYLLFAGLCAMALEQAALLLWKR